MQPDPKPRYPYATEAEVAAFAGLIVQDYRDGRNRTGADLETDRLNWYKFVHPDFADRWMDLVAGPASYYLADETGGFDGSAFSFALAPGESIRDRIVRCCHEALDPGPMGANDRHADYKSFLSAGNEPDDDSAEFLTHVRTSCAIFVRAIHLWCGGAAKGHYLPGTSIFVNIDVPGPDAPFASPSFMEAGTGEPRPGDSFFLADPADWNTAHTGIFVAKNDDGSWTTAEGGGGDGTLCRFKTRTIVGKRFADEWVRKLWGWFDCTKIGLPASPASAPADETAGVLDWLRERVQDDAIERLLLAEEERVARIMGGWTLADPAWQPRAVREGVAITDANLPQVRAALPELARVSDERLKTARWDAPQDTLGWPLHPGAWWVGAEYGTDRHGGAELPDITPDNRNRGVIVGQPANPLHWDDGCIIGNTIVDADGNGTPIPGRPPVSVLKTGDAGETGGVLDWLRERVLDDPDDPVAPPAPDAPPAPFPSPAPQGNRIRGSAFMSSLPAGADGASRALRAKALLAAARAGVVLPIIWKKVVSRAGGHEGWFWVSSDTLRWGVAGNNPDPTDWDWVRVSSSATTWQQIADLLGVLLPTARLSDLAYLQADVKLEPHIVTPVSAAKGAMLEHHALIEADRARKLSDRRAADAGHGDIRPLWSTVGKDWILARELWASPGTLRPLHPLGERGAVNYGWHTKRPPRLHGPFQWPVGAPNAVVLWQQPGHRHDRWHEDDSQMNRFVHPVCVVDGTRRATADVYTSPELSILVSMDGPMGGYRMPNVPRPEGARELLRIAPDDTDTGETGGVLDGVLGGFDDLLGGTPTVPTPASPALASASASGRMHWVKTNDPTNNLDATVHGAVVRPDRIAFSTSVDGYSYDVTLAPAPGSPARWTGRWSYVGGGGEGSVDVRLYRSPAGVALVGHWQEKGDWWWFGELRPDASSDTGDPFAGLGTFLAGLEPLAGAVENALGGKHGGTGRRPPSGPRAARASVPAPALDPDGEDARVLAGLGRIDEGIHMAEQYPQLASLPTQGAGISQPGPDTGGPVVPLQRGNMRVFVDRASHIIRIVGVQEFRGDGASDAYIKAATGCINRTWSVRTDFENATYTVICTVTGRRGGDRPDPTANQVEVKLTSDPDRVTANRDPSHARGTRLCLRSNDMEGGVVVPAHEFGHSMGLADEYTEGWGSRLGSRTGLWDRECICTGPAFGLMGDTRPGSSPTGANFEDLVDGRSGRERGAS